MADLDLDAIRAKLAGVLDDTTEVLNPAPPVRTLKAEELV